MRSRGFSKSGDGPIIREGSADLQAEARNIGRASGLPVVEKSDSLAVSSDNPSSCRSPKSSRAEAYSSVSSWFNLTITQRAGKSMIFKDYNLLRGTSVGNVLAAAGAIFSMKQPCTAEYYERSRKVDDLDCFLSHNWSTCRFRKFLVIAVHFNSTAALVIAAICVFIFSFLQATGFFPLFSITIGRHERNVGIGCSLAVNIVYILSLLFWHEVAIRVRHKGPVLFVDKVCVHQTDETLKKAGIENLAAFICQSREILVCYSKTYLRRLWTVYEVATFMLIHPGKSMNIRPEFFPIMIFAGNAIFSLRHAMWFAVHAFFTPKEQCIMAEWTQVMLDCGLESDLMLDLIVLWPTTVSFMVVMRMWIMEQKQVLDHVAHFHIKDAACFDERDRIVVQRNIGVFMKHFGYVRESATEEETHAAFEDLVRAELPSAFRASLGTVGIPYKQLLGITLPKMAGGFDWASSMVMEGAPLNMAFQPLVLRAGICFGVFPIFVFLLNGFLWLTVSWKAWAVHPCMAILSFVVAMAAAVILFEAREIEMIPGDGVRLRLFSLILSVLLVTCFLYRPSCARRTHAAASLLAAMQVSTGSIVTDNNQNLDVSTAQCENVFMTI